MATYRYTGLSFPVADNTSVQLELKFVTDGNTCHTSVNVPDDLDPEFDDDDTVFIGKGKALRKERTIVATAAANIAPEEDTITIEYYLNDVLIQTHTNLKADDAEPLIILKIKFPKP